MYRPTPEDFDDIRTLASSAEPMLRPDHKAKKKSRPRRNEKVGGGHFVFRRGERNGRVTPSGYPFEHPNIDSARTEAERLQKQNGGRYDVLSVSSIVDGADWDDQQDAA